MAQTADAAAVQRAFRKMAKDLHPDGAGGDAAKFDRALAARTLLLEPPGRTPSRTPVSERSAPAATRPPVDDLTMAPVPTWLWPLFALAGVGFLVILGLVLVAAALSGVESTPIDVPTTPVEVVEECVRITDTGVKEVPCGAPEAMRIASYSEMNAACPAGTGKLQVLDGGTYCLKPA